MEKLSGEKIYKLCKKYGKINVISEPITNIYLSELEYNLLKILPGAKITKRRYKLAGGNLDVFPEESKIAPVFEIEFASEDDAQNYVPPEFVTIEITGNDALSGASLARGRA